ncbi:DMT family transporter [bacterium endosymbiont of Bathymodiolus sp. 5 South]|jgi:drug/metabolite transporter (DMT)-like permease|uniref:DMT family transporter n=1 Tax=bacterium endosymbiont of Bathymodiolus sp. 5 South TaxID=1181670 RepID=UPI0010B25B83|nr:DMT family transporter [bacterium endosymbiont of Bathymodiolus sp. 5 South]VVH55690.1 Permease of the drug/metabolite transporter (DMT) superfamily [uncultured Gammaproteobacteria bacterium]SHN92525.1 Permease of the drug/metabolite transporter (DMT) superfamily [bacterium endosymbiont of Bathymodiolus sp. 5 South]SSC08165.1 Permease of the drug/metabolite transporter (DMT) superfamily [bacterium endosymbiont of Bathymodiolus sp. 5 South]VVH62445.1 Permease of the drug/metabolite transporte
MPVIFVFLSVVAIWSTTPLAIVWSTLGTSPSFGVASRMLIGLGVCLLLLLIKRQKLTLTPLSLRNYFYAGLGIFVTLSLVYYASQNLASGIISIVFGLTPIMTGVFALILLKDKFFSVNKILGLLLGLGGLVVIFSHSLTESKDLIRGLLAITLSMAFQAFISVKLKQINTQISVLETTTGALLFSTPWFVVIWFLSEGTIPTITMKAALSIGYLSIFGSVIGFMSYYYLIKRASVKVVGIVPLITPIFALLLGSALNNETLTLTQLGGIVLVLIGLGYYEYGKKNLNRIIS